MAMRFGCASCACKLLSHSPKAFSSDYAAAALQTVEHWQERTALFAAGETQTVYVAAHRDALVGMAGIYCGNSPKTAHSAGIWGAFVAPEYRGNGIAGDLIQGCLDWAQLKGLVVVKLAVISENEPAIRCYTRLGFTTYGVEPKALLYDGMNDDELLMARLIAPVLQS